MCYKTVFRRTNYEGRLDCTPCKGIIKSRCIKSNIGLTICNEHFDRFHITDKYILFYNMLNEAEANFRLPNFTQNHGLIACNRQC